MSVILVRDEVQHCGFSVRPMAWLPTQTEAPAESEWDEVRATNMHEFPREVFSIEPL